MLLITNGLLEKDTGGLIMNMMNKKKRTGRKLLIPLLAALMVYDDDSLSYADCLCGHADQLEY